MKISEIIEVLETLAPLPYQESYDNSGLLLGTQEEDCRAVLVSLDTTEAVIAEAVHKGCNLVISHHPMIFRGLKQISPQTGTGRTVIAAIKNDITVYAIHTNLDNVQPGVNTTIADKLGLVDRQFLYTKAGAAGGAQVQG